MVTNRRAELQLSGEKMQLSSFSRRASRHALLVSCALALAACGGGGDGGAGTDSNTGAPPAGSGRSGTMVYSSINKILSVNMATGATRTLSTLDYVLSYVGAGVGPDGDVALAYNSSSTGPTSEFTILKADGSTQTSPRLPYMIEGPPKFSPDGTQLAFTVSTRAASGSGRSYATQVVSTGGENLYYYDNYDRPNWTPDGRLVMISQDGKLDLYVTPVKDTDPLQRIPNSSNIGSFSIHPDGTKIAFARGAGNGAPRHIYVMNFDGTNTSQVTTSAASSEETRVVYSPNGKELLITSYGCIGVSDNGMGTGDLDRDLIHLISADSRMVDIRSLANSGASSRLLDENGSTRCTGVTPGWR
jgi:dipeptidyl aminopeptidase/acylaminoacyl peptidase